MLKTVDYRTTRAIQIAIVFMGTLALQRWLDFSHAGWIGFAVMMIYAGFDPGTSVHRSIHRFWGAMFGLFLSYILFFLIRLDYDMIMVVIPLMVFMAYFTLSKYYVAPTIFTVTLTALGSDYYQNDHYVIDIFFFDYGKATILALGMCVSFEHFVFRKSNLTHKFYYELQQTLVQQLHTLYHLVSQTPLRRSRHLKLSTDFMTNHQKLVAFLKTAKHDTHVRAHLFDELQAFNQGVEQVYQNIQQVSVLGHKPDVRLRLKIKHALYRLDKMSEEPLDET